MTADRFLMLPIPFACETKLSPPVQSTVSYNLTVHFTSRSLMYPLISLCTLYSLLWLSIILALTFPVHDTRVAPDVSRCELHPRMDLP